MHIVDYEFADSAQKFCIKIKIANCLSRPNHLNGKSATQKKRIDMSLLCQGIRVSTGTRIIPIEMGLTVKKSTATFKETRLNKTSRKAHILGVVSPLFFHAENFRCGHTLKLGSHCGFSTRIPHPIQRWFHLISASHLF